MSDGSGVFTTSGGLSAETLPLPSLASTVYEYVVLGTTPRSVKLVAVGLAISSPSRRTS